MSRRSTIWRVPLAIALTACGQRPAPVESPVPRAGASTPAAPPVTAQVIAGAPCLVAPGSDACLATPLSRLRRDSAAAAFARGLMPLNSAGVRKFATDHPTWDGRGILIAILDSGIDPSVPGLASTVEGSPKVLDLRDFSREGRVRLQPAIRHGDTLLVGTRRVLGASHVAALSGDAPIWGGTVIESALGKAPAADLNGNGSIADTLVVIVVRGTTGWTLFADTDGDGTIANDRPVRDYLVARELFGWYPSRPGELRRGSAPVGIAVNLADSAGTPVLDLFYDTSSHGTHVAGIAAGHNLYGVTGFDGVAPGAQLIGLKISDDAHGDVSVTGSMVRALDYAIRFARERSMPLVVNLSFGVGNDHPGTARIDELIDSVLAAHPDVVMTVAAGNDGPGLNTLGFPGSASRIVSVGATLPPVFAGAPTDDPRGETVASFSARGGETSGPDFVLPGAAYSTVPPFAVGEEQASGTSMASPFGAGLAARLLSGLRTAGRVTPARLVRQSLRISARPLLPDAAADEGAGLPDLTRAWQWLAAPHDLADIAVDIGAATSRGAVFLTAANDGVAGRPLAARVVLRRLDGPGPLTVRLRSDATWLQIPETVTLTGGRAEFTIAIQQGTARAPGVLATTIRIEGPDETSGPIAVIPVVVRIPVPASGTRAPVTLNVAAGAVGRLFVSADTGRGLQIEVATRSASERVLAALHEPGGMPFRDDRTIPAGFGGETGVFDIGAEDVVGGVYEVDVVAGPLAPISATVAVRQSPVRLGASLNRDTLHVTARSVGASIDSVRLRAGLIGAERRIMVQQDGDGPVRVTVPVPSWAARMVVDTRMPRQQWLRFTDFGVSYLDQRGREFDTSPINYAFSRAAPELPDSIAGDSVTILLSPGFADPRERGHWSIELAVRFYVEKPYALDGDGSPFRSIAAGAIRDERFVPGALPISFPPEFLPLVTIVALEGNDHIWTRQLVLTGPRVSPK